MRTLLLALCFTSTQVFAGDPWDTTDKVLGAAALTTWIIDWGQTRDIAKRPNEFRELNVFLGEHPSVSKVDNYFVAVGIGGYLFANWLSSENRKTFLSVFTTIELINVGRNHGLGINIAF